MLKKRLQTISIQFVCKRDFQEVTLLCEVCLEFCINAFGSLNLFAKKKQMDSVAKQYFQ